MKDGVAISLSRRLDTVKALDNESPFALTPIRDGDFAMDEYKIAYHGFAHTHMDALGHMSVGGRATTAFLRLRRAKTSTGLQSKITRTGSLLAAC